MGKAVSSQIAVDGDKKESKKKFSHRKFSFYIVIYILIMFSSLD